MSNATKSRIQLERKTEKYTSVPEQTIIPEQKKAIVSGLGIFAIAGFSLATLGATSQIMDNSAISGQAFIACLIVFCLSVFAILDRTSVKKS
jgi:hypothetical protein